MTLTVCGVGDTGFAASACSHPAERAELTATKSAMIIRKLIPASNERQLPKVIVQRLLTRKHTAPAKVST